MKSEKRQIVASHFSLIPNGLVFYLPEICPKSSNGFGSNRRIGDPNAARRASGQRGLESQTNGLSLFLFRDIQTLYLFRRAERRATRSRRNCRRPLFPFVRQIRAAAAKRPASRIRHKPFSMRLFPLFCRLPFFRFARLV